ncbi:hypothetical protein BU15DRAFT_86911 [Melanogaster broomeanus]|nr:hypothetical protein BU15DRAFT_86911 [Melanogaster broomeanus]
MELGANFSARLEPFLLMSKSARGAAAAKLIQDATSAPGVFVFAELLELPNIQELANNEQHASSLSLLQLFSFRTYRDYLENKDSLPPLNQAQITKLRYLTIVTLATERRILPYSLLLQELKVESIRELEDLIIDAIYLDILRGKLDQKEQQLEIEYHDGKGSRSRKAREGAGGAAELVCISSRVLSSSSTGSPSDVGRVRRHLCLQSWITEARGAAAYNVKVNAEAEDHERIYLANLKEVQERQKDGKGGRRTAPFAPSMADNMDVDDPSSDGPKIRNRKAPTDPMMKQQQRKRNRF